MHVVSYDVFTYATVIEVSGITLFGPYACICPPGENAHHSKEWYREMDHLDELAEAGHREDPARARRPHMTLDSPMKRGSHLSDVEGW